MLLIFFLVGAAGALAKDIIEDGKITLPRKVNNSLILGSLGGIIIGGTAGVIADNNLITAFATGYAGTSAIQNILSTTKPKKEHTKKTITEIIREIANKKKVSPNLAVRVAQCESGLNPEAVNVNTDGSRDRGLYQINDKWHPEVTDEQAFDPIFSTNFFCDAVLRNKLSWWNSSKKCWKA